ncbi:MAG: D-aminoacyl-tRNA deacylase [bacterium]|nr:D-aminoacyl-tRNA deacylase [bacterium]
MVAVVQRVKRAQVSVNNNIISQIGAGLLVLVGVHKSDTEAEVAFLAKKLPGLRIFADPAGKMNLSLLDVQGELLLVSQFTLCADMDSGRRPSFTEAASPEIATGLLEKLIKSLREQGVTVQTGEFAASMQVELVNDGPVTFILDSRRQKAVGA